MSKLVYKYKEVKENGYVITENGHIMFPEDVIKTIKSLKQSSVYKDENYQSVIEINKSQTNKIKELKEENDSLKFNYEDAKENARIFIAECNELRIKKIKFEAENEKLKSYNQLEIDLSLKVVQLEAEKAELLQFACDNCTGICYYDECKIYKFKGK